MTTTKTTEVPSDFQFPDPERKPDEITSFKHLALTGSAHHLSQHFGNPETTLVTGEQFMSPVVTQNMAGLKFPDLLIAFGVDPVAFYRRNAYVISEQGKPPDFVLEVASRSTGREDTVVKPEAYAALGIPEYWRFDETGDFHGARIAGDRLVNGEYMPITIERLSEDALQGRSEVLGLDLRWHAGQLEWHDPATGRHIVTFDDERFRADSAESRAVAAEARADDEREGRIQAESRVRELEEELRRMRGA